MSALRSGPGMPVQRRWLVVMWLASWLAYAGFFQAEWAFGERPVYFLTGDEPHYLVTAVSLWRDHDLDVLNNYQSQDYFTFYPYHLGDPRDPEDMHALYGRGGHLYSKHGLGLSLLTLPALALGGAGAAKLLLMGVAALLSVQTFLLALDVTGRHRAALVAWLAVAFTPPLLLYADQVYPEVPGALLIVVAVRATLAVPLSRRAALACGACLGLLPWLHLRYIPVGAAISAALAWRAAQGAWRASRGWGSRRSLAASLARSALGWAALPALAGGLALLWLDWRLYGGVPRVDEYGSVALANLLPGIPGLLLDRQFGLLVYSPVLASGLAGLTGLAGRSLGWVVLLPLAVYTLFIGSFSFWYGAFSPPARMLVPVAPLLVAPIALVLARHANGVTRALLVVLLGLSWAMTWLLVEIPRLRYNLPDGSSQALAHLSRVWGWDVEHLLPSLIAPAAGDYALAAAWLAGIAAVGWATIALPKRRAGEGLRGHLRPTRPPARRAAPQP